MIFIDTNFFVAMLNKKDSKHKRALEILHLLKTPEWGTRLISDYVLDETITFLWSHTRNKNIVKYFYVNLILNNNFARIEKITSEDIDQSWKIWNKYAEYPKRPLSFTDCTILALLDRLKINTLITFDDEFNGLVEKIIF